MQATVGLLVAKTLTNATANPFLSGGAGSYNPVLALDVFLVQVWLSPVVLDLAWLRPLRTAFSSSSFSEVAQIGHMNLACRKLSLYIVSGCTACT